jgi:carboxymethylenebutenolidase
MLGDDPADVAEGMRVATMLGLDAALKAVEAAVSDGRSLAGPRVAVLGYCFGGTLAWFSTTRLNPTAAVCYYGGRIVQHASEVPRRAVMMHFGDRDAHIPSQKSKRSSVSTLICRSSSTMPDTDSIVISGPTFSQKQRV